MEFSRQEYWSGKPFPSPGDLPNTGIKPRLLHCRQILYHLRHQGSPPRRLSRLRIYLQCRRPRRLGFSPWARKIPWWRKWQPITVFLPGNFHRERSLSGYSPWGHKDLDMTEHAVNVLHESLLLAAFNNLFCWAC